MTSEPEKPLTDEDLKVLLAFPLSDLALAELKRENGMVLGVPMTRLVAEVLRLRSDEWLAPAAAEIARWREWSESSVGDKIAATEAEIESWPRPETHDYVANDASLVLAILRKHRDGKP